MRISKSNAAIAAKKAAEPLKAEYEKIREALRAKVTTIAKKRIPRAILNNYKKYPRYFNKVGYTYIKGVGISYRESIIFTESIPFPDSALELDKDESKEVLALIEQYEAKEEEYKKAKLDLQSAITGFGTIKQLKENMPQLIPFLPIKTETAVSIPVKELTKKYGKLLEKQA